MAVTSSLAAFTVYNMRVSSGHCDGGAYHDNAFFDTLRHKTRKISETYIFFINFQAEPMVWFGIHKGLVSLLIAL